MAGAAAWAPSDFFFLPPFFTLQPVDTSRAKQLALWTEHITGYLQANRKCVVRVPEDLKTPLFSNERIQRALSAEDARTVLDHLGKQGFAAWQDEAKKTECIVSWKTFDDWGSLIAAWAQGAGLVGTVSTVYELRAGDETRREEFHGLDVQVVLRAIATLRARGVVVLIDKHDDGSPVPPDEVGIKFVAK